MSVIIIDQRTLAVCGDCLYFAANGWDERVTGNPLPDPAPMRLLPGYDLSSVDDDPEPYFSWGPCQGCGDTLGGSRYDVVATLYGDPASHGETHGHPLVATTCGTCGRAWCAECIPGPSSRCPFEDRHAEEEPSWDETDDEEPASCPACGEYIDFCMGHGPIGDPVGFDVLDRHDNDDHSRCHVNGCDVAAEELGPIHIDVHPMDGFTLSAMSGNYRIARRYVDYSRTEALRDFRPRLREAGAWS